MGTLFFFKNKLKNRHFRVFNLESSKGFQGTHWRAYNASKPPAAKQLRGFDSDVERLRFSALRASVWTWHNMAEKCSVPGSKIFSNPLAKYTQEFYLYYLYLYLYYKS